MTLQAIPGGLVPIGPNLFSANGFNSSPAMASTNAAIICVGRLVTSDGGSHTLDTSGSSSIWWQTAGSTFANGSSSLSVGIAPVDTSAGPPARASATSSVINFDVKAVYTGGGGGLPVTSQITSVPTSGTKTMAHGDLIAIAAQMTARAGSDTVAISVPAANLATSRPSQVYLNGGSYFQQSLVMPSFFITFSDGAYGWLEGSDVSSNYTIRTFNSGSATKEYGQLYQLPFPVKVWGLYGYGNATNDFTLNLYSDPLGTPTVQKSASIAAKTVLNNSSNWFVEMFSSPYSASANQPLGAVFTPGASNISAGYKTMGQAIHRIVDNWGTSGYGISRASGAFANSNSSLDHYQVGLLVSAFDDAAGGGGGGSTIYGVIGS